MGTRGLGTLEQPIGERAIEMTPTAGPRLSRQFYILKGERLWSSICSDILALDYEFSGRARQSRTRRMEARHL
jgi:hypothetical protein